MLITDLYHTEDSAAISAKAEWRQTRHCDEHHTCYTYDTHDLENKGGNIIFKVLLKAQSTTISHQILSAILNNRWISKTVFKSINGQGKQAKLKNKNMENSNLTL